ncbi:transmembrane 220 family protein [Microbaculum sp. FT89]|uniref:transmembrane 220 family protein n=1 Tax=Microbaculum sp. FT89 TaxID=3447298 RepID=UPI003F53C1D4
MRIVYGVICVIMLLFVGVQYNDPDGPLWMLIYGVPALLAGLAAWRPAIVHQGIGRAALLVCLGLAVAGTLYYWPTMPGFWNMQVWWVEETAREGLGVMIMAAGLLILALPLMLRRG